MFIILYLKYSETVPVGESLQSSDYDTFVYYYDSNDQEKKPEKVVQTDISSEEIQGQQIAQTPKNKPSKVVKILRRPNIVRKGSPKANSVNSNQIQTASNTNSKQNSFVLTTNQANPNMSNGLRPNVVQNDSRVEKLSAQGTKLEEMASTHLDAQQDRFNASTMNASSEGKPPNSLKCNIQELHLPRGLLDRIKLHVQYAQCQLLLAKDLIDFVTRSLFLEMLSGN